MPLIIANFANLVTGLQIQNQGGTATDVTVTYTPSLAGTACTETQTIAANSSATFTINAMSLAANPGPTTTCTMGAEFVGSAQVTTNSAN